MFGYVTPCKMELKIKEYEEIKSYYCGLCRSLKYNFGNLPRLTINYDMSFLAIFLDSLNSKQNNYIKRSCILHPIKKRIFVVENSSIEYAAFLNFTLAYHKLLDDIADDNSIKGKVFSALLKPYFKKAPKEYLNIEKNISMCLDKLYKMEEKANIENLDELSHPFGELTAYSILAFGNNEKFQEELYHLGYNLGKWIYVIDAYDDLEDDLKSNKFNAIDATLNKDNMPYESLVKLVHQRIDFVLASYARECSETLKLLPIEKNYDILYNIFNFGMLEKMNHVFTKRRSNNERSL